MWEQYLIKAIVYLVYAVVLLILLSPLMGRKHPPVFSHWYHLTEGLQISAQDFYESLVGALKKRKLPETKATKISYREGGVLTAKREYFRVKRKGLCFDVCASLFGNGFFISWWLGETRGPIAAIVGVIPLLGPFLMKMFRPETYYQLDTALMFQESVHLAVLEVLDQKIQEKGLRALSDEERKPILRDLRKR